jgi:dihydrofolate synthase / folylpolyglutamate synthase
VTHPALLALESLSPRGMKLGLESIEEILRRLGHPERARPHVLIGGTNGKGSTAATLSAIFRAAGVRAGLHTSPHLIRVTERVRVGDEDVSEEAFGSAVGEVLSAAAAAPEVSVTYFEAVTAAAEVVFDREACGAAVVEVGLGGRLDATNASDPVLSAVTSIDLDHVADLGGTTAAIAREKAGIFRRGRPAVCAVPDPEVRAVLEGEAARAGAIFVDVLADTRVLSRRETAFGQAFSLETARGTHVLESPLRGAHQARNVAVAVTAAELLRSEFPALTPRAIADGVSRTRWPGRLELFRLEFRDVWLDGCHNAEGARALAAFLAGRPAPIDLLFGVMRDKDAAAIAGSLFPLARRIVLTVPETDRAASAAELEERLGPLARGAELSGSVAEGLERLLGSPGGEIVVAGSLYLVGEARRRLLETGAERPAQRRQGRAIA